MIVTPALALISTAAASAAGFAGHRLHHALRNRGLDHCFVPLIRDSIRRRGSQRTHVLLCIADHFEPRWGDPSDSIAARRVENWVTQYPDRFQTFCDSDGRPPRHSFFFPIDQYDEEHVEAIGNLCRRGFGEVELHLHHDRDTEANLRKTLERFTRILADSHGLLSRRRDGRLAYGFIHGNWALDNARPDGRWCGVNNELDILRETGCYADFTLPSAPSPTQTHTINSIYYAVDDPCCAKSHDVGIRIGNTTQPNNSLMLIQGPLLIDWRRRRLENGCLQQSQPPSMKRLDRWIDAQVGVPQRPDWVFVKLHTHGAPESNQEVLLGEPMDRFHRELADRARRDERFRYHYVTAREMYNLARAAEAGFAGEVRDVLDYELVSNLDRDATHAAA